MYSNKNGSALSVFVIIFLVGAVLFLITYIYMTEYYDDGSNNVSYDVKNVSYVANTDNNVETENDFSNVFENGIKSIVGISALKVSPSIVVENNNGTSITMGSGIIVSKNGYIITNQHVAGNENDKVFVTLYNGNAYEGITKWTDKVIDLAIVKIEENNLDVAVLGNSDELKLGTEVYAIGNPLGLDFQRTVTSGIISALNRTIKITDESSNSYMENLIQTDASINPGNSGGALINEEGEVVGINTIKITEAEGIGFAIPINIVKPIINKYSEYDSFEEAYLGIFAYDNILLSYNNANSNIDGLLVANVDKFGPLKNCNIQVGDVLVSVDDLKLNTMVELRKYLYTKNPNDSINIKYLNSNNEMQIDKIVLSKKNKS